MKDEKEWLVSNATCRGCKYYGMLSWSSHEKWCMYTYHTGKIRTDKPKDCTVKEIGKRLVAEDELRKLRQRPKKGTV